MSKIASIASARLLRSAGLYLILQGEWNYDRKHARALIWDAQDGYCACCERRLMPHLRYPMSGDRDTLEHVWPQGYGGPDKLGNLVLLTFNCNSRKGGRWPGRREVETLAAVNTVLGWPTPRLPYVDRRAA